MELLIEEERLCVASVVKAELLRGAASDHERSDVESYWQNLTLLEANDAVWNDAGQLAYRLRRKGISPGLIDCYLACLAMRHDVTLITLDKGFEPIRQHCSLQLEPV
jgi:predicted nucleic acid-binding protein